MKRIVLVALAPLLFFSQGFSQPVIRNIITPEYKALQQKLSKGWNTWYNNSMLSHVLLPDGFSINICLTSPGSPEYVSQIFKAADIHNRPEKTLPGIRSDDGYYTSIKVKYQVDTIEVQSATDGNDEIILVTPSKKAANTIVVEAGLLWGKNGSIGKENGQLVARLPGKIIKLYTTGSVVADGYSATSAPHIAFTMQQEIGICTGKKRTIDEIKAILQNHRSAQEKRINDFGDLAESFKAMQTILAWNTTYDAANNRVLTPVSRLWSNGWGGFVLFDWDNYFASYMFSLFNKDLAYANAIEITKAITPSGFVPNYQSPYGNTSWDRSEPPVGSLVILNIYKRYKETWFLKEVYNELLSWNKWWSQKRDRNGYLCWGSDLISDTLKRISDNDLQAAKYESGLDNSPMYDSIPFNKQTATMELADVGLMSLYIADCNSLAEIADILGKTDDAVEIRKRSSFYTKQLATLWDEQKGIFLNKRIDNGEKSNVLSPTNFYPLLAKACTQQQAERMIKEHYFNPDEFYGEYVMPSIARNVPAFKDNDYWRGRIWGPMNFLVYLGMRNYNLQIARTDLVKKSKSLLMKNWQAEGGVYENYNSVTGEGGDVKSADAFYHWGALLTFMEFIERGYMDGH
ncbi:MAG: trehalase family glycosidase [Chitinophagaceae bacterium]